ncbi:MAG: TIGR02281 family clan AA aspartic protease [Pseudomonadota bacterium]
MSSGLQSILIEVIKWTGLTVLVALFIFNFDVVKAHLAAVAGLPSKEQIQAAHTNRHTRPPAVSEGPTVVLKAQRNGHFFAPVRLNGREIQTMVDTGASSVALTYEDAQAAGIYVNNSDFTHRARTANGVTRIAPVMIDRIEIDGITVRNVKGSVMEPGKLHVTLLGMSFLGKLRRFEMSEGNLILRN